MNLKALIEKRNELIESMNGMIDSAKAENRAMTAEEVGKFGEMEEEVRTITGNINAINAMNGIEAIEDEQPTDEETRAMQAFVDYVMENRTNEQNITMGNNGAIIPTTIVNRIIKKVKELCPIYAQATVYSVKGTLKIPVWGPKTVEGTAHDIAVDYATEFSELTADSGAFTSVDLTGYLVGALTLIGRSVENNAQFSVVDFIVNQMAEEIAAFLEKELLTGTGHSNNHCAGACSTTTTVTATYKSSVTADDLIDVQGAIPQVCQENACWIMSRATFTAIKKLKNDDGDYILNHDFSLAFPYRILGKPVYISQHMAALGTTNNIPIIYGDMSGLAVNMREGISMQILREKYATQHALGCVAWLEVDSVVADNQRIVALKCGSSDPQ